MKDNSSKDVLTLFKLNLQVIVILLAALGIIVDQESAHIITQSFYFQMGIVGFIMNMFILLFYL